MHRRLVFVVIGSLVLVSVIVAILELFFSPQNLTVCPSGCDFSQIQRAIDAARRGSTLQIQGGTYTEDLSITKPIKLLGDPIINGQITISKTRGVMIAGLSGQVRGQITISKAEDVIIAGVAVRGTVRIAESQKIRLAGNKISQSASDGIAIIKSDEVVLQYNTITANGGDGIHIESSRVEIDVNIIGGNKGYGISSDSASQLSGKANKSGYRVPGDFRTTQAAIDAWAVGMGINGLGNVNENVPKELLTGDGGIFVAPGVYKEQLTIRDKNIRIRGADRETVIIDGTGLGDVDGITIRGTAKVFLEGLTVRNFRDDGIDAEGQIELTLRNIVLEGNGSTGAEIAHSDIKVWLSQSIIRNNRTYGLWALSPQNIVECRETSVAENTTDFGSLNEAAAAEIAQKCQ